MKIFQGLGLPRPRAVAALPRAATGPAAAEAAAAAAGGAAAAAAPGGGSEGGAGGKGADTWTKKWGTWGNFGILRKKWCKMMETRGFHGKIWWNMMDTHDTHGFSGEQWWNMMKSREIHGFFMIFHDNICTHHVGFIEKNDGFPHLIVLGRLLRKKWWVVNSINVENPLDSRSENNLQVVDFPYLIVSIKRMNKVGQHGKAPWKRTF